MILGKYLILYPIIQSINSSSNNDDKEQNLNSTTIKQILQVDASGCSAYTIKAKLFNFDMKSPLAISFVYVNCKMCGYLNVLPFHFINSIANSKFRNMYVYNVDSIGHLNQFYNNNKTNQSSEYWIFDAKPCNMIVNENNQYPEYYYACPCCKKNKNKTIVLNFIYRFPFILIDEQKNKLEPCIMENEVAYRFINNVRPIDYCLNFSIEILRKIFRIKIWL
jgi:hypothetical protein